MITLCLDFGNTRLKAAIFTQDNFTTDMVIEGDPLAFIESLIAQYKPGKSILSSVINHDVAIETLLASKTKFHKLTYATKLNFSSPVG